MVNITKIITLYENGDLKKADDLLEIAIKDNNIDFSTLYLMGIVKFELGETYLAINYLKKALERDLSNDGCMCNIAAMYQQLNKLDHSLEYYNKALTVNPRNRIALANKGMVLNDLNILEEALNIFKELIGENDGDKNNHLNLGIVYSKLGNDEEALRSFNYAIKLDYKFSQAYSNRGNIEARLNLVDDAKKSYELALGYDQNNVTAAFNKGKLHFELGEFTESINCYGLALSIEQNDPEIFFARAMSLASSHDLNQALTDFENAIQLNPNNPEYYLNIGVTYHELARFDKAIESFDKAIDLRDDYYDAIWNKSLSILIKGDYEVGLSFYESRFYTSDNAKGIIDRFHKPFWTCNESIKNKTLLIFSEQGLGDTINFCRYIELAKELASKIIFVVHDSLKSLVKHSFQLDYVITFDEIIPEHDFVCSLLSLPLIFKTTINNIPNQNCYITTYTDKIAAWEKKLGARKRKMRIGLAWSSVSKFKNDYLRSINLEQFIKYIPLDDFEFICLQKEIKEEDIGIYNNIKDQIPFFGEELHDFSDTAALSSCLDLVISTCTSVPHLTAAMGIETWILLQYVPDWRWMMYRNDSPWYESVKLFRQEKLGEWDNVLLQIKSELNKLPR